MLVQIYLTAVLALQFQTVQKVDPAKAKLVDPARAKLVGKWQVVAVESDDGKMTPVDEPWGPFVITDTTMSLYVKDTIVWQAKYRLDTSKSPPVMHQEVTRAPCMSGNRHSEATYLLQGDMLRFDGLELKRERR